jgi:hypothetical protein
MATVHVQGSCPSCHRESLILDPDHHLVCDDPGCPNPVAVTDLLEAAR